MRFEKHTLFMMGDKSLPELAEQNIRINEALKKLAGAKVQLARKYFEGEMNGADVITWSLDFGFSDPTTAAGLVTFFDTYRSYIVTYGEGEKLVLGWIQRTAQPTPSARWEAFNRLLRATAPPSVFMS